MIRHTILFKVKPYTPAHVIEEAINNMVALKNKLTGIFSIMAGECQFHDEKSVEFFMEGISHAISIDFKDQEALDRFFTDPITHSAKDGIVNITDGGYKGIVGLDFLSDK